MAKAQGKGARGLPLEDARAAGAPLLDIGELTIIIRPRELAFCEYVGTRMQLEAEGIIPVDTAWPDGYRDCNWQAAGLRFCLRRQRPEGAKGPRRAFIDCDNWCLRMERIGANTIHDFIERKAAELRELRHRQTPEWKEAWGEQLRRHCAAEKDEKFQAFTAAYLPSFAAANGKRRGRLRPKAIVIKSPEA